jgi:hypothetical protein
MSMADSRLHKVGIAVTLAPQLLMIFCATLALAISGPTL